MTDEFDTASDDAELEPTLSWTVKTRTGAPRPRQARHEEVGTSERGDLFQSEIVTASALPVAWLLVALVKIFVSESLLPTRYSIVRACVVVG